MAKVLNLKEFSDRNLVYTISQIKQQGSLVLDIQERLQALGFYGGALDSILGRQTELAMVRFARSVWLNSWSTGLYGKTWAAALLCKTEICSEDLPLPKRQVEQFFGTELDHYEVLDLNSCATTFDISTKNRRCHFLSQIAHETGGLKWLVELADGWDYDPSVNPGLARDLGNTEKGDGPLYKGAGAIMLTGRYNYQRFSNYMDDPKVMQGHQYVYKTYPFSAAGWFWEMKNLNSLCDQDASVERITRVVNGGTNGLSERKEYYFRAQSIF